MAYPQPLSSLDSLIFDNVDFSTFDQESADADLALWSNAQFTIDIDPSQLLDAKRPVKHVQEKPNLDQNGGLDHAMYEKLSNYIDYELPAQQYKVEQPSLASLQPLPVQTLQQRNILPKQIEAVNTTPMNTPLPTPLPEPTLKRPAKRPSPDSAATVSAEEDKRRRNTAASARFRVKKKMREQEKEQKMQEMSQTADVLQNRVNELEMEVKYLRNLLIEKNAIKAV